MKKLSVAFLLFLGLTSSLLAQQSVIVPATMASITIVGNTATALLVTGQAGKSIYVTAVDLIPVAGSTVQFIQGTGPTCGTGTSNLTGSLVFSAGQTYLKGDGYGTFWVLAQGNSLCVVIG